VLQMWGLHGAAGQNVLRVDWEFPSYFVSANPIAFRLPRAKKAIVNGQEVRTTLQGMCVVVDTHTVKLDQPLDYAFDDAASRPMHASHVQRPESHRYAGSMGLSRILLRETVGVGVQVGDSFNAKRIRIEGGSLSGLQYAVWCKNGSLITKAVNTPNNEANYRLERGSEYWHLEDDNTEASRRHLLLGTGMPVTCAPSRLDNSYQEPGAGYIELFANASCPLHMFGGCVDQNVPEPGTTIFEATPSSARLHLHDTVFQPIDWKDTGVETFRVAYDVYNCTGIRGMPGSHATYAGDHGVKANIRHLRYRTNNVQGGAADVVHMQADTKDGTPYVARQTVIEPLYGANEIIAHRRVLGDPRKLDGVPVTDEVHQTLFVLDETVFPHYEGASRAPGAFLMHRLVPPVLGPGAGVMAEMVLHDVRNFAASGAARRYVYLRTDMNMELLGRVLLGVALGVPDDGAIPAGSGQFFRDPTTRALCMRVKDDDGTATTYTLAERTP
jgi:hypothetical protein